MTKPMGMEDFDFTDETRQAEEFSTPIAMQTVGALTRWSANGDVEFFGREGEWTTKIHKAYLVPKSHIKDIGFYAAIDPVDGESHSIVTMVLYPEDKQRPFYSSVLPSASNAPVRREWHDCVAIAQPLGADKAVIRGAELLFLSHHGVDGGATILTDDLARAVVCELGQIDDSIVARLNGFGIGKAPGWQECLQIKPKPARRVISVAPITAGPK